MEDCLAPETVLTFSETGKSPVPIEIRTQDRPARGINTTKFTTAFTATYPSTN